MLRNLFCVLTKLIIHYETFLDCNLLISLQLILNSSATNSAKNSLGFQIEYMVPSGEVECSSHFAVLYNIYYTVVFY